MWWQVLLVEDMLKVIQGLPICAVCLFGVD